MRLLKTVPKFVTFLVVTLILSFLLVRVITPVFSYSTADQLEDEIDQKKQELENQKSRLSDIEKRISDIANSSYSLTQKVNMLNQEITSIQTEIDARNAEIEAKLKEIEDKQNLLNNKKSLLDMISTDLYMESRHDGSQLLFSSSTLDKMLKNLFVKKSAINILTEEIEKINGEFISLADSKASLEKEKEELDLQKKDLDDSYSLLVAERNKLQSELSKQNAEKTSVTKSINGLNAQLSDLQYQLVIARQGGTNVNLDSVPTSSDINSSLAGFRANAPAGSFAVFSIGAYTHRNGMSQWGAKARAESGQNYTQILNAYYPGKDIRTGTVVISGVSENIMSTISTTTYGTLSFEDDYLLRLGEVPESWPMEVLKAQAISARTYAINYTQNGRKSICTNESCQVVGSTQKTGAWKQAVEATRGMVLTSGGVPFSTQYAAVHGGWINGVGWDTTDGIGNGDWMSRAWESKSGISWFYKSWYRTGYSNTASSCGRYPWLSQSEMSDLLNAYQVWKAHNMADSRIVPIFDACHASGNPYSYAETYALASKKVSSVSLVVTSNSNGYTSNITFYTNAGTISMSGNDFKTIYNLRAPGYLRIPQSGFVHINIEKK